MTYFYENEMYSWDVICDQPDFLSKSTKQDTPIKDNNKKINKYKTVFPLCVFLPSRCDATE